MKTTIKTIKGWANKSNYLFSQNSENKTFSANLESYKNTHLKGFKQLGEFETLKGKRATEKVIIKGWYWGGSWSDPTKEIVFTFYK